MMRESQRTAATRETAATQAWFEATHTDFDLYEQGCEGSWGECTGLYEQAMDPALYIDVSKIADANRDVYFETFFMAGILSRFEGLRRLPCLGWTRAHLTMPGVVSSSILRRPDAPRRPVFSRVSRTCR